MRALVREIFGWPHPFSLATPLINESSCNDFLYNEHPTHGLGFFKSLRKFFTSAGDEDDDNSENEDASKRPSTEPAKHS